MKAEQYLFRNCPIPGGGYVTGFLFSEKDEGVLYCRTDIGGTYKFDYEKEEWLSLIDHVTMEKPDETFPIALALDPDDSNVLYIACGVGMNSENANSDEGVLAISRDGGSSFEYKELPFFVHGNLNGRGTGFRLIVDKKNRHKLIMASQINGLWTSDDQGSTWNRVDGFNETHTTFVGQNPDGSILFAAGAGVSSCRSNKLRGHSLFFSLDNGGSFIPLIGPEDEELEGVAFAGHVAQRYTVDEQYLYVTYAIMGRNAYVHENGYSCDGGSVIGGRIYRYAWTDMLEANLEGVEGKDITPEEYPSSTSIYEGLLEYGFSGISKGENGLLIASTISKENGDCVYRSMDNGESWECILFKLSRGVMDFKTSYMKPEFNGGSNLIHWLSDLKINPHNNSEAWFNTGTGVFVTKNLLDDTVVFSDCCRGIEETVHLNLYAPPTGDVKLIDILGDLGGFAFRNLDEPCENSFADENGNRYITCINADYSDSNANEVIVTPRGNWTGKTKGGLIVSEDGCKTFKRLALPYGLTEELDEAFRLIEMPNVNSGWVAMSADSGTYVWSVANMITLPISRVIVSNDKGTTWKLAKVVDLDGNVKTAGGFKVFADRVEANIFYGLGSESDIYVSTDFGNTFMQVKLEVAEDTGCTFPQIDFSKIDCANKTEVRVDSGYIGHIYMALGEGGLWELDIDATSKCARAKKISKSGDYIYRVGLGLGFPGADYFKDPKALYIAATIDGEYGFYRTVDSGTTYVKLNNESQMFGDINSLEADPRVYGRFFLATGSRGVIYGEPIS